MIIAKSALTAFHDEFVSLHFADKEKRKKFLPGSKYEPEELGIVNSNEGRRLKIKEMLEASGIPVSIQANKGIEAKIGCGQFRTIVTKM